MSNTDSATQSSSKSPLNIEDNMQELIVRYSDRLKGLVHREFQRGKLNGKLESNDVLQSVFATFWRRYARDKSEKLVGRDSEDLWRLLAQITHRRCIRHRRRTSRLKRDVTREQPLQNAPETSLSKQGPTDEDLIVFNDSLEYLLEMVEPEVRWMVVELLNGASKAWIAEKLQRTERTVNRRLQRFRKLVDELAAGEF